MSEDEKQVESGVQRAPLNKVWVIKIVIITVALLAFGGYGFYDAVSAYPKRGEAYASFCQWQYLQKLNEAEREQFGIFTSEASVADPVAALAQLTDPETLSRLSTSAADPGSSSSLRAQARLNRLQWLRGLKTIGRVSPEFTTIENPQVTLAELAQFWSTRDPPKGLAFYDIPSQWIIVVGAWGFSAWLILLMMRTVGRKYTWDPGEQRLSIRGGSFVPADLGEVDKRKWDKFIVFLRMNEGHELGTAEIKFDTYRHAQLEGWILEMEEARFGPQEDSEDKTTKPKTKSETTPTTQDANPDDADSENNEGESKES